MQGVVPNTVMRIDYADDKLAKDQAWADDQGWVAEKEAEGHVDDNFQGRESRDLEIDDVVGLIVEVDGVAKPDPRNDKDESDDQKQGRYEHLIG